MKLTLGVIVGSTREGRMGERVARWVQRAAETTERWNVQWIDLAEWAFPNYRHPSPTKVAEQSYSDPRERAWVELVRGMDGFIVVAPEYNHGYPAALKNALDYAYAGWNRKPVAFVSYGGSSGGVRAVQQLRQVAVELQMAPVRDEVNIPFVGRALDEHGEPKEEFHRKRLDALLSDIAWWAETLKTGRSRL
ncbi:MAG: NADPH-dependent FMN reductase [Myxococcaceae bacterium]